MDSPFGRYKVPTRKVSVIGAAILLAVVGVMEGSYANLAPEKDAASSNNSGYELSYSVIQNIKTETLFIGSGDSVESSFEIGDTSNAIISISLFVSYGESNEAVTSNCDEVFTTPDFSDTNGPHDDVIDSPSSTTDCDETNQLMAFVATDSNLSMWAENGSGEYSIQGTDSELNSIRETMGDSFSMQGVYRSDVAVETNAPPLVPDNGESVTITWIALSFVPEEVKMAS